MNWVRPRCWVDLWEQGLPPLLRGRRDKRNPPNVLQQPERHQLLHNTSPGFRHGQKREPSFAIHPARQDGNHIAEEHTARNKGSGDEEKRPRQRNGGETDPTQEAFSHLCVHGGQSHTGQGHRHQALGGSTAAVILHQIQETVKQAGGCGQEHEQGQEPDRTDTFLQAATETHQCYNVQEKLGEGLVVKWVKEKPVDVSVQKHSGADAEDLLSEVKVGLDAKQETRHKEHCDDPAGEDRDNVSDNL